MQTIKFNEYVIEVPDGTKLTIEDGGKRIVVETAPVSQHSTFPIYMNPFSSLGNITFTTTPTLTSDTTLSFLPTDTAREPQC